MSQSWDDSQIATFAKRFALAHKASWPAYVDLVREALIDHCVMLIAGVAL